MFIISCDYDNLSFHIASELSFDYGNLHSMALNYSVSNAEAAEFAVKSSEGKIIVMIYTNGLISESQSINDTSFEAVQSNYSSIERQNKKLVTRQSSHFFSDAF